MDDISIKQLFDKFIESGCTHRASSTRKYYETNISYFFLYLESELGVPASSISLSALPDDVLSRYVIWLRARDKYSGHPLRGRMNVNGTIKSNTINTYMRAEKCFFDFMYSSHFTEIRYTEGLKLPRSDSDQIVPLLQGEVHAIDGVFDRESANDLRNLCMIHLMLDAGLRSCEVIGLTPGDIIFASSAIIINRSKADKSRAVIMCPPLSLLLHEYNDIFKPSGTLFRKTTENKAVNESVMNSLFKRIIRNTGIERLHPHGSL